MSITNTMQLPVIMCCAALILSGCSERLVRLTGRSTGSYSVNGKTYQPQDKVPIGYTEQGIASWYGPGFTGKKTASGENFHMSGFTAAHKTLPLNSLVRVTNLDNRRSIDLRINDRGPFARERILDLSKAAARKLGILGKGLAVVRMTVIGKAPDPTSGTQTAGRSGSEAPFSSNPFLSRPPRRVAAK